MSKLIKNTALYTLGNILPKAASFILLPLYTRYLTPKDYGIVQSMMVLSVILTIFFTMAIDHSVFRLYFDHNTRKAKKDFLGTIVITLVLNATIFLIIIFLGKNLVSKIFLSISFYPFYLYIILTVYLTVFGLIPKLYLQIEEKAVKYILISLSEFIISTLLIIYFIVFKEKGAEGMLFARLIKSIVFVPLFIIILFKIVNFTFKKDIITESIIFSLPLVPVLLSSWVLNLSDRIFIEKYFNLEDVGIYSLAYSLAGILLLFSAGFNKAYVALFLKIANTEKENIAKNKLFRYNKVYSIIVIISALGISLYAKEFISLLDEKYYSAYRLVPIIMIGILFNEISGLFNKSILQEKKTKQIMVIYLGAAIINILLNFFFVKKYGVFGAAYATTITFILTFWVTYICSKKCFYIPVAWKELGLYLGISVIVILVFLVFQVNIWVDLLTKTFVFVMLVFLVMNRYKKTILYILRTS